MEFNLRGIKVGFSFEFFAVIALYMLLDRMGIGLLALAAIVIHEGGHILAMRAVRAPIVSLGFYPFGIKLNQGENRLSYAQEIFIFTAGPGSNLLTAAICGIILQMLAVFSETLAAFLTVNILLAVFNLLPVGRLDGGQIVKSFLFHMLPEDKIYWVRILQRILGFMVLTPMFALSFYLLGAPERNITLLFTSVYLAYCVWKG